MITKLYPKIPAMSSFGPKYAKWYSTTGAKVSDFALKKKGTGKGPFVQLPEFRSLQDAILIRIPASCTVYGNLKNINAVSTDPNPNGLPFLSQEYDKATGLSKLSTGQSPINLLMASSTSISNVAIVKIDSYQEGLYIPDFHENVLCYCGDLILDTHNQLKGLGIVAIAGKGPVYQLRLAKDEEMLVTSEAILAYDSKVDVHLTTLRSNFSVPKQLRHFLQKLTNSFSQRLIVYWNKLFNRDKLICKVKGPGLFFLQTQSTPASKLYSNKELKDVIQ